MNEEKAVLRRVFEEMRESNDFHLRLFGQLAVEYADLLNDIYELTIKLHKINKEMSIIRNKIEKEVLMAVEGGKRKYSNEDIRKAIIFEKLQDHNHYQDLERDHMIKRITLSNLENTLISYQKAMSLLGRG